MQDFLNAISQNSQALVTILNVLSPFIILLIVNNQTARIKKMENEFTLEKARMEKELGAEFETKGKQRDHENLVLSSLVKILFEVQKLHIEISCGEDNLDCIDRATAEFQNAFNKHQSVISDNQLYLPSQIIDHLYRFYRQLAALLIDLQSLRRDEHLDLAIACVYDYAQQLADEIIEVQSYIVERRNDLAVEFKKEHIRMMRNCCGTEPSAEVRARYEILKKRATQLPPLSKDALVKLEGNS